MGFRLKKYIKKWRFPSSSNKNKKYTMSLTDDYYFECSCRGWINHRGRDRDYKCTHIKEMLYHIERYWGAQDASVRVLWSIGTRRRVFKEHHILEVVMSEEFDKFLEHWGVESMPVEATGDDADLLDSILLGVKYEEGR